MTSRRRDDLSARLALLDDDSVAPAEASLTPSGHAAVVVGRHALADALKEAHARLETLQRAAVHTLDPSVITISPDSERWPTAYSEQDPTYRALRDSIRRTHGNVTPGLVRPAPDRPGTYLLICGHRRFHACRDLGLPFRAVITDCDDRTAALLAAAENSARADLSAWEIAQRCQRWLERGWVTDQRDLATALGLSTAQVSRYLAVARFPAPLLPFLRDPREITAKTAAAVRARWTGAIPASLAGVAPGTLHPKALLRHLSPDTAEVTSKRVPLGTTSSPWGYYIGGAKPRIVLVRPLTPSELTTLGAVDLGLPPITPGKRRMG